MNETNPTNQTRRMLTRDPILTALLNLECRTATHCVSALEDDGEPARVWCQNITHAEEVSKVLAKHGFSNIEIEEA